jgi:predicted Zn-dependent protease
MTRRPSLIATIVALALAAPTFVASDARAQWTDWLKGDWVDRLSEAIITPEQERQIAESEHPKILAQFGGEYGDQALKDYLTQLVNTLGKASTRPDIQYRVTLLNSPVVNAFALPAGYLYTTRGLLALAGSEAEIAGVMAHEIGHVTARHTAQRYGRSVLASGASGLAGILNMPVLEQAIAMGGQLWIQSFSREQEFQADELGVATMARAGYDPLAMSSFLNKLQLHSDLQATLAGRKPGDSDHFNLFATHPRTADRVERAIEQAGLSGVKRGREDRDAYLRRVDGVLYGDDPDQGFVRGRTFLHPALKLRFEVPEGFQILNGAEEVTATGPAGAVIRFDNAPESYRGPMRGYVTDLWARQAPLGQVEQLNVNAMEGASALSRLNTQSGPIDVRFTAVRFSPDRIFRFQFMAPSQVMAQLGPEFGKVTGSFRRLTDQEAASLKPYRLHLVTAGSGDTVETLSRRMTQPSNQVERFRALNGLKPGDSVAAGRLYKIVSD